MYCFLNEKKNLKLENLKIKILILRTETWIIKIEINRD